VINAYLHALLQLSKSLQIIGQICAFNREVPLFITIVRGEPLNWGPRNVAIRN